MFIFPLLKSLIHLTLDLLSQGVHLVLLLLDQFGFCGYDLLVAGLQVPISLFFFHLEGFYLHLMCFGISIIRFMIKITYYFYLAKFCCIYLRLSSSALSLKVRGSVYSSLCLFSSNSLICLSSRPLRAWPSWASI